MAQLRMRLLRPLALALWLALSQLTPLAAHAAADATWTAGPGASGDNTYLGFIDGPLPGATMLLYSPLVVRGWVVDQTALGWTGIDDVQIYLGLQDQGGTLLAQGRVGQRRDDVVAAFGNPYWAGAGFTASLTTAGLTVGPNLLTVYAHTPDKGWWYRQIEVRIQPLPSLAFADDPLVEVREALPSIDVDQRAPALILRGWAIDRNVPVNAPVGVGGSGVSQIQFYLDGPRNGGTFLGNGQLGQKNREATGFGERFLQSGWEMTLHPSDFSIDKHALFIYAASAYWPNETLVIVPFTVR